MILLSKMPHGTGMSLETGYQICRLFPIVATTKANYYGDVVGCMVHIRHDMVEKDMGVHLVRDLNHPYVASQSMIILAGEYGSRI